MSEADKLRELVQKAASAVTSAQQSDFSEVESLLGLLEEIGGYVDQVAAIPDQLKEQTKYATTSASEIVQALLAKEIDNTDESLQSVSRMICTLGALTEQLGLEGNEGELENLVGEADEFEDSGGGEVEDVKPVREEQKEQVGEELKGQSPAVEDGSAEKFESSPEQKDDASVKADSSEAASPKPGSSEPGGTPDGTESSISEPEEGTEAEVESVQEVSESKTEPAEGVSDQEKGDALDGEVKVKADESAAEDEQAVGQDSKEAAENVSVEEKSQEPPAKVESSEESVESGQVEDSQESEASLKTEGGEVLDSGTDAEVEGEVEGQVQAEVKEPGQSAAEDSQESNQEESSEVSAEADSSDKDNSASGSEQGQEAAEPTVLDEDDLPLVMDFITEAAEHIESVEAGLLEVENSPGDSEAVNLIFRGFHTIKGMAGFLNLTDIGSLAHAAENLLDMGRKGDLELTGNNMNVVFESVDQLKSMMESLQEAVNGSLTVKSSPELPALIGRLKACTQGEGGGGGGDQVVSSAGVSESAKSSEVDKSGDSAAKEAVQEDTAGGDVTEKPAEGPSGGTDSEAEVKTDDNRGAVDDKSDAEQKAGAVDQEVSKESSGVGTEGAVDKSEAVKSKEADSSDSSGGTNEAESAKLENKKDSFGGDSGGGQPAAEGAGKAGASLNKKAASSDEKIKVSTQRLDELVNMVGELVIAQSMVIQGISNNNALSQEHDLFGKINHQGKIVRELQELSMMMRMVPIQGVFQKMARLVRDLSQKSGKKVNFITEGEDTELDRIVVDQIADPLVHMIRNSVDHGIESNEDRKAAGKEPVGTVQLRAFHQAGNIVIEIIDDGKGLDKEKILNKAISNGIVSESDNLSDQDIYKLVFSAGLSTAAKVTDISGRGVGMDVVKKNIESLRGKIDIVSEKGKGTTFTIRLPLTMAIIDGQVVRIGSQRYIIPIVSIECCIRPEEKDINTVAGRGEMAMVHGSLIPMVRLYRLFGVKPDTEVAHESSLVVVEEDGKRGSLMVDELLGQHQVVIKSLGGGLSNVAGISGGAIMGDGKVSLIIDVPGLLESAWTR